MVISKEEARHHLDLWLEADSAISTGQSYTMGTLTLKRADLDAVRKQIEYWRARLTEAENAERSAGARSRGYYVIPRDL